MTRKQPQHMHLRCLVRTGISVVLTLLAPLANAQERAAQKPKLEELRLLAEKGDGAAQELLVQMLAERNIRTDPQTGLSKADYDDETIRWKKELGRDGRSDVSRKTKSKHQQDLAWHYYRAAAPSYESTGASCKAAIDYAKSAIANGDKCAGRLLRQTSRLGRCSAKDDREANMWTVLTIGCPTP